MKVNTNPLARFKSDDPMLDWQMLSDRTGLSIQTLISVASKDEEKIGGVTIATSERIRRKLGIDLGNFYKFKQ